MCVCVCEAKEVIIEDVYKRVFTSFRYKRELYNVRVSFVARIVYVAIRLRKINGHVCRPA